MQNILTLLKKHIPLTKKTKLVVSVSGGSDSMALLDMLRVCPAQIIVVHFNHLQRDQSYEEAKMVEAYANTHELNYHYYVLDLSGPNFQHQAHILRRHYLKEVAKIHKTSYILTAHHVDDLLESILMKLTKGSNLLGYAGMQYIHEKEGFTFIKPLLYTDKKSILNYVRTQEVPFMEDRSNYEDDYLRNRYRHTVVPIMKQENPNILETALRYHNQLTQAFDFIRKHTLSYLGNKESFSIATYQKLDEALKDDVLAYLIESYQLKANHRSLMKIKSMLASSKPNQSYQLSSDLHFIKSYDNAFIKPLPQSENIKITLQEGLVRYKNMSIFTFFDESANVTEEFTKLCYNKLAFPLLLRHKKDGDVLTYDYGHKKLKKLLIDLKIPKEDRVNLWVITDNNDTILMVGSIYINQTLGNKKSLYIHITEDPHA